MEVWSILNWHHMKVITKTRADGAPWGYFLVTKAVTGSKFTELVGLF